MSSRVSTSETEIKTKRTSFLDVNGKLMRRGSLTFGFGLKKRNKESSKTQDETDTLPNLDVNDANVKMKAEINDHALKDLAFVDTADEVESVKKWWYIPPDSRFRRIWNGYIFIVMVYVALVSVYAMCFLGLNSPSSAIFWFERLVDVSFFTDIYINSVTGVEKTNGEIISTQPEIFMRYLKTWLVIDIVSSVPWDIVAFAIEGQFQSQPSYVTLLRLLKLIRLLKLPKTLQKLRLLSWVTRLEVRLRVKYARIRMIFLFLLFMLIAHWIACLFYFFAAVQLPKFTWIQNTADGTDSSNFVLYIYALYFSIYTITTIGYGDVVPETTLSQVYCIFAMGLGAALFALIVSNVSALVNEMSSADIYYRTVMDQLTDYARQRALPPKLHYAIRRYFVHLREFKLFSSDADLLDALSPELRAKVMLHTYKSASENSSLLKLLDAASFGTLCAETEQKSYAAGEALYEPEDSAWCIYYLVHGLAKRLTSNDVEIEQLRAGAVFGDRGLFFHRPRQDRVVCTTPCDFVIFPRNAVLVALRKNPDWIAAVEAEESLKLWAHAIFVAKQKARILMLSRRLIDYLNTTDGSEIRKELSLLRQMKNNPSFVFDNENGDESERETGRIPNMDPENINTAGSPPGLHRSEVPTDDEINNSGPVHDSSGSASLSRSDRSLGVFESVRSPATITRSIASRASGSRAALPYNSNDSNSGYKAARDINRAAKILEQLNSSLAAISEQIVELSSYEEQENNVHDATMHH